MNKRAPARRPNDKLSNLILEGGEGQSYPHGGADEVIHADSNQGVETEGTTTKRRDKAALAQAEERTRHGPMRRAGSVVDETAGAIRSRGPAPSARRLRKLAAEAIARGAVERMGQ
jgi:hypothetical protein